LSALVLLCVDVAGVLLFAKSFAMFFHKLEVSIVWNAVVLSSRQSVQTQQRQQKNGAKNEGGFPSLAVHH